jgi:heme/copper-type cytochrome/quinol oxidase subunit 2
MFSPEQRKKRITFWTIACSFVLVVMTFCTFIFSVADLVASSQQSSFHPSMARDILQMQIFRGIMGFLFFVFIVFPGIIAHFVTYWFYVLRLWEEVPPEFARNTPKTMACLSIIPIFCWFWMFIALPGLYQDMDKATKSYGRSARFGTVLILAACIFWLLDHLIGCMLSFAGGFAEGISPGNDFSTFVSVVGLFSMWLTCAVTLPMLWIIRGKVIAFIDIKSSVGR